MLRAAPRPLAAAITAAIVPIPLHAVVGHNAGLRTAQREHHRTVQRQHQLALQQRSAHRQRERPRKRARHAGANAVLALTIAHPHRGASRTPGASRTAHAAGDPADAISDFKFTPGTVTIHVGDTITWTNLGPSPHTATATNHSFDTGTLNKGGSASHTFSTPGTFAYICTIHPFMHGTVVVLANAQTTAPAPSSGSSAPAKKSSASSSGSTTATTPAAGSATTPAAGSTATGSHTDAPTLPNTGLDLPATLITSGLLIGAGVLVRRGGRRARSR